VAARTSCSTTRRRDSYERRRPDETLLYQLIEEHWPTFLERAEQSGGLPDFIIEEFEAYLRCGILEHSLAHFACRRCGESLVVAYSCKKRGFCPSCTGRRMAGVAAHLVDEVIPEVPVRQWVCSLPWRLRYAMGYDRKLCADVLDAFIVSLCRSLRRRAKLQLGLRSVEDALSGAVTFIQRADSSLRLKRALRIERDASESRRPRTIPGIGSAFVGHANDDVIDEVQSQGDRGLTAPPLPIAPNVRREAGRAGKAGEGALARHPLEPRSQDVDLTFSMMPAEGEIRAVGWVTLGMAPGFMRAQSSDGARELGVVGIEGLRSLVEAQGLDVIAILFVERSDDEGAPKRGVPAVGEPEHRERGIKALVSGSALARASRARAKTQLLLVAEVVDLLLACVGHIRRAEGPHASGPERALGDGDARRVELFRTRDLAAAVVVVARGPQLERIFDSRAGWRDWTFDLLDGDWLERSGRASRRRRRGTRDEDRPRRSDRRYSPGPAHHQPGYSTCSLAGRSTPRQEERHHARGGSWRSAR
jgi:hypothetical protein